MILKNCFFKLFCLILSCFIFVSCVASQSPYHRPIEELSFVYNPRPDGKYADFSGWGGTYMMHRLCLDRCGKGRRMGGEFEDEFFAVIKEIAPSKKELALIRQQILRGIKTFSFVSKQENFIDLLMEQSKQVCENPQMITNQILGKMRTFGIDWRDNYSKK